MNTKEFFEKVLASQALSDEQIRTLSEHREEVEGYLREKFGQEPTIRYAGSKAKGTMIAESYDLDLTCYFPSSKDKTLKEIHDEVQKVLSIKYSIEPKASAVRIKRIDNDMETDYHIDVVPGRFVEGNDGDAFLHVTYGEKERMQTNIDTHITYVKESGCQSIIKLVKLWKVRNNVPIKTFVMEIAVVETLKGSRDKDDLAKSLREVLTRLRDEMESMRLEDPANSNNIVSEVVSVSDKNTIAIRAAEALQILKDNERDELAGWQKVFDEESETNKWSGPTVITNPSKPHCDI
jgi:hypothetical protein